MRVALALLSLAALSLAVDRPALVFSPGLMGSMLKWKMPPSKSHLPFTCHFVSVSNYSVIWVSPIQIVEHLTCLVGSSKFIPSDTLDDLGYPRQSYIYQGYVGYSIPNYGNLTAVRALGSENPSVVNTPYFFYMERFLKKYGWKGEGIDIFAAPYDWRFAPSGFTNPSVDFGGQSSSSDFQRYKKLVETAYAQTKRPVVLVGHSMGGSFVHTFLGTQSQGWINKHVKLAVLIAPAVAGSYNAFGALLGSVNFYQLQVPGLLSAIHTWPSMAFLATLDEFAGNKTIATYNGINYNSKNIDQLYTKIFGAADMAHYQEIRRRTSQIMLKTPKTQYHIMIGDSQPTDVQYKVTSIGSNKSSCSVSAKGRGDGTVPYESLRALVNVWQNATDSTDVSGQVTAVTFKGGDHSSYVNDQSIVETLSGVELIKVIEKSYNEKYEQVLNEEDLPSYVFDDSSPQMNDILPGFF